MPFTRDFLKKLLEEECTDNATKSIAIIMVSSSLIEIFATLFYDVFIQRNNSYCFENVQNHLKNDSSSAYQGLVVDVSIITTADVFLRQDMSSVICYIYMHEGRQGRGGKRIEIKEEEMQVLQRKDRQQPILSYRIRIQNRVRTDSSPLFHL